MHYYQFNIGDYKRHTFHLDPLEDIAYRRILDLYYLNDGPVTADADRLAKQIGMVGHLEQIAYVLGEFFELDGETFRNSRADQEIAEYAAKADRARANGKKGGRPKADSNPEKTQSVMSGIPEVTQKEPDGKLTINHKPITINQDKDPKDKDSPDSSNQAAPKGKAKGSRLPAGFVVPDEWIEWATVNTAVPLADIQREALSFVDYWIAQPGAKGMKADWLATWRNWIRRRETEQPKGRGGYRAPLKSNLEILREASIAAIQNGTVDFDPDKPFD